MSTQTTFIATANNLLQHLQTVIVWTATLVIALLCLFLGCQGRAGKLEEEEGIVVGVDVSRELRQVGTALDNIRANSALDAEVVQLVYQLAQEESVVGVVGEADCVRVGNYALQLQQQNQALHCAIEGLLAGAVNAKGRVRPECWAEMMQVLESQALLREEQTSRFRERLRAISENMHTLSSTHKALSQDTKQLANLPDTISTTLSTIFTHVTKQTTPRQPQPQTQPQQQQHKKPVLAMSQQTHKKHALAADAADNQSALPASKRARVDDLSSTAATTLGHTETPKGETEPSSTKTTSFHTESWQGRKLHLEDRFTNNEA